MPSLFVESPREKAQHRIQQFEAAYPDFATLNDAHQHTLTVRCAAAVKALISARRWSVMSPELTRWRSLGKARAYQRAKRAVKELNEMKSYPVEAGITDATTTAAVQALVSASDGYTLVHAAVEDGQISEKVIERVREVAVQSEQTSGDLKHVCDEGRHASAHDRDFRLEVRLNDAGF